MPPWRRAGRRGTAGYKRFWIAEHHGMAGIAGGATSVVLAHIGHATRTIRIGSGGIMLPNHNPFVIAEQFGTLDALFPGRVDLGLGRAPGADGRSARPCARTCTRRPSSFPQDVVELRALLPAIRSCRSLATPGTGAAGRDVDARLEPVRRPARGACSGCPMPLPALRARPSRCGAGALPRAVPPSDSCSSRT